MNTTARLKKTQQGFTLIELLVVIGILAVLLAITLIAINPARQFAQANNTKRASDVNALLNAIHQYGADNRGNLSGLGTISVDPLTPTQISLAGIGQPFCDALITEYMAALPVDPLTDNGDPVTDCAAPGWDTGYTVYQTAADNRLTITAPATELPATVDITVTR
jgi:prepilin-type N-terminal cleavage/methylation domain-containing protein